MLKTFNLVRWVFLLAAIGSAGYLYLEVVRFVEYREFEVGQDWRRYMLLRVMPWVGALGILLNMTEFTVYMIFTRRCYRAIELRQSDLFNESFKWLLRNTKLAMAVMLLNLLAVGFYMWDHIKTVWEQVPQV